MYCTSRSILSLFYSLGTNRFFHLETIVLRLVVYSCALADVADAIVRVLQVLVVLSLYILEHTCVLSCFVDNAHRNTGSFFLINYTICS